MLGGPRPRADARGYSNTAPSGPTFVDTCGIGVQPAVGLHCPMSDRDHADILAPAPVLTAVCVLGAWIAQWAMPLALLPPGFGALRITLSILLFGAFVGLGVLAVRELVRGGSSPNPYSPSGALITSGVYRWTRNPIYVGDLAFVAGLAIALSSVWYVVATLLLFVLLHYGVVRREERYLAGKFGSAYDDYRRQVRRWL